MTDPVPYRIPRTGGHLRRTPLRRSPAAIVVACALAVGGCGAEGEDAATDAQGQAGGSASTSTPAPAGPQGPFGPGDTEIFVGTLAAEGDSLVATGLRNVTGRDGYDNQPAFTQDGSAIYYTVVDSAGQADIWRVSLAGQRTQVTTSSPESEYSATPMPAGGAFSAVVVEPDSTQRLWRFPYGGGAPAVLFPDVAPVGYHGWAGEEWVAMFVLGDPATLVIAGGETLESEEVARDVGRSIQSIPGEAAVSFVQRVADGTSGAGAGDAAGERAGGTRIMRWSRADGVTPLTDALDGGDFHAWTPSGFLLMGSGDRVMAWREGWDAWRHVATVPHGGTVSRLAVSPTGTHVAVVVGPPPGAGG